MLFPLGSLDLGKSLVKKMSRKTPFCRFLQCCFCWPLAAVVFLHNQNISASIWLKNVSPSSLTRATNERTKELSHFLSSMASSIPPLTFTGGDFLQRLFFPA